MRASLRLTVFGCLAFSASACSWSRFDDVTENSPVVLLDKPGAMKSGFGVTLTTVSNGEQTELLVGGTVTSSGAALYEIGQGESPSTTAIDTGFCSGSGKPCFLSSSPAGFANANGPDQQLRPLCFAVGTGAVGTGKQGLVMQCKDGNEYALEMPLAAQELLATSIAKNQPLDYPLAADRGADPLLLASQPELHLAWFYPTKSLTRSELAWPDALQVDDPNFGRSLAVLAVDGGRVLALGVPGKSQVLLWKTDNSDKSSYIGCLGGTNGMGRALAAGKINADGSDDLVVSDDTQVHAIDGASLFRLPETTSSQCGFSSLPAAARLGSFGCGSTSNVSGCEQSEFGAAVAVGDLDGDGDGEVIVGAPRMTVRDQEDAGALLVYDADLATDTALADARFISSAERGDQLGRTIVTPHLGKRDIIAAGAPGHGKAALFYCSALHPAGEAGSRCP